MNLEGIMLNEIRQTKTNIVCYIYMQILKKQKEFTDTVNNPVDTNGAGKVGKMEIED